MLNPALYEILGLVVVGLALFILFGVLVARLYKRASKETSFVRTGLGGESVVVNGGALVLPVLHEIIPVNMATLRLEVTRNSEQALITKDRMRVDVLAEFYVRVAPNREAISAAAQTLGRRTMAPQELKELIEGKFVDALRSVAAELTMNELHEQRTQFVQKVQQAVTEDLTKNGLELETVSLTGLDQTPREFFNPDNAFDAEGLTKLTEEIEMRRKMRNDIETNTRVEIERQNLETQKRSLEIKLEEEAATLSQQREIQTMRAQQAAEVALVTAEKSRESEAAKIAAERDIEQERIAKEQANRQRQIESLRATETAELEKKRALELAEQDRQIAIANKSKEESVAKADANKARAIAIRAEEQVKTVQETEVAERNRAIELIEAARLAERDAIAVKVGAEAEKIAATDRAEAAKLIAMGEAEAIAIRAEADAKRFAVQAEGERAINEAANVMSAEQVAMRIRESLISKLDQIIAASVEPLKNIDSIKVVDVSGLGGASGPSGEVAQGNGNLADQVVQSAMRYRAQAPLIDSILKEVGLGNGGPAQMGLAGLLQDGEAGPAKDEKST
ncbi:flotillin domain-containing protein [Aquidulcibacter sp.]|uniref:flotillin family protein n=1 Tax=Aquidulcibacter sp. TaxID=2052990 RepID=UPI0025BBF33A|nr:flotillin domain-containing protein [Aquidulcibacter sp.]MCA3696763.1 flotillin family protein [Aquidulcibacter sp.]